MDSLSDVRETVQTWRESIPRYWYALLLAGTVSAVTGVLSVIAYVWWHNRESPIDVPSQVEE